MFGYNLGQTIIGTHLLLHILSITVVAGSSIWPSLGIYCQCAQPLVFKFSASRTSALTLLAEFLDALTVTRVVKKHPNQRWGREGQGIFPAVISSVGLITTIIPIFISHEIPIPKSSTSSQSFESIFLLLPASLPTGLPSCMQLGDPSFSARFGGLLNFRTLRSASMYQSSMVVHSNTRDFRHPAAAHLSYRCLHPEMRLENRR